MSLRRRLIIGTLVLLVAAITTTDIVTYSSLRSFLIGRLDEQIDVAQAQAYRYVDDTFQSDLQSGVVPLATVTDEQDWLAGLMTGRSCVPDSFGVDVGPQLPVSNPHVRTLSPVALANRLDPDVYVEVIDSSGATVFCDASGSTTHPDPAPRLPSQLQVQARPTIHQFGGSHGAYLPDAPSFTLASASPSTTYRGQAIAVPGGTLLTAIALNPTNDTLSSLVNVELVVSLAVLILAVLVGLVVVWIGLRPLDHMTETAGAIADGDLTRRVRSADDATEVGRLGNALNGMLSQIEAAFTERTRSEGRLRRFVADASHELRTPLTSIRGYAELLRKDAFRDAADRRRAAERIEHEAARMGLLVDDLLLLARLDQRRPLELNDVDLAEVARQAVDDAAIARPIQAVTFEAEDGVVVQGDRLRLRQIVDNLLSNAAEHTPAGTPVHVRVEASGDEARLVVRDEGPGLPAEQLPHVFERFYRGTAARTRGGAGLGLSIVAALATAHGGSASVESDGESGAVFTVTLPLATSGTAPGVAPPSGAGTAGADTAGTGTAGADSAGTGTAGAGTAGADSAGTGTAGADSAGAGTAGAGTAGADTAGSGGDHDDDAWTETDRFAPRVHH